MASVKEEAMRIVEALPDEATWDDLMYELYVNKKVAAGKADAEAGKVVSHQQARKRAAKS
ncbi:MAG TPA: hypothetical protein VHM02_16240 [Thermoanaerobaculia bacterium]|nr:hypothetical protein [Thermoanaerobaculia bacterium]